jgi:hypothetical protein
MQPGDEFIRYSKQGDAVRGRVAKVWTKESIDPKNKVVIRRVMIQSDAGYQYDANECYVIDREISASFLRKVMQFFKKKITERSLPLARRS